MSNGHKYHISEGTNGPDSCCPLPWGFPYPPYPLPLAQDPTSAHTGASHIAMLTGVSATPLLSLPAPCPPPHTHTLQFIKRKSNCANYCTELKEYKISICILYFSPLTSEDIYGL